MDEIDNEIRRFTRDYFNNSDKPDEFYANIKSLFPVEGVCDDCNTLDSFGYCPNLGFNPIDVERIGCIDFKSK